MSDQDMSSDDERFLDDLYDVAAERLAAGGVVEPQELVGDRTDLLDQAAEMIRLAREVALVAPRGAPAVPGYELRYELGSGSSGTVYFAGQLNLGGRPVALKVLNRQAAADARARRRFLHEARTLAKFRHPSLVPVFDVVEADGVCAFAMEWIDGRTLADLIGAVREAQEPGRVEPLARRLGVTAADFRFETTLHFFCRAIVGAARGLAAVHEAGLLHRDVKPSNILVRKDGTALLSDLGLVRDPEQSLQTQTGMFVGTPAYASPEQLRGDRPLDVRSDLFSLGATFYECLTLQRPFGTGSGIAALQQRETGAFVSPRKLNPRLPRDLDVIVSKALDPDPARRYATAKAFADDVEQFLAFRPIQARPTGPTTRLLRFARRNRVPLGAASVAVAVVVVALFFLGFLGGQKRTPHGTVRFSNLAPDLVVEQNAGTSALPSWKNLSIGAQGEVEVEPGRTRLRVHQRNCFPFVLPEFEIQDGAVRGAAYPALPIALSSFLMGPAERPALLFSRPGGGMGLLAERWRRAIFVDPFLGRPVNETIVEPATARWVLREAAESRPALLGSFYALEKNRASDLRAQEAAADAPLWRSPLRVAAAGLLPDLDGDGVLDLAALGDEGTLYVVSGLSGAGRPLCALPEFSAGAIAGCIGPEGAAYVLLAGTEAGAGRLIAVEAKAGGKVRRRAMTYPGDLFSFFAVAQADGPPKVVLAGTFGCRLVNPWSDEKEVTLSENNAVATIVHRSSPGELGIAVAEAERLALFDATGFLRLWTVPFDASSRRSVLPLQIAAGNLDGDPGDELVLGSADGSVTAFSGATGEELWNFETHGAIKFPPLVADLDGDGFADVVVLSADGYVYVLAGTVRYRRWIADVGWPIGGRPALVRLADGRRVVLAAGAQTADKPFDLGMPGPSLRAFDAKTGAPFWAPRRAAVAFLVSPDVEDLDGDGVPEALAQDRDGTLASFRVSDGRPCIRLKLDAADAFNGPPPRVVDVDGRREIVVCVTEMQNGARHARITAFDPRSGERLWNTTDGLPAHVWSMESGVFGADGRMKIVCGTEGSGVVLLDAAHGGVVQTFAAKETIHPGVVIADVTGDGVNDLVFGLAKSQSSVVVVDGRDLRVAWRRTLDEGGIDAKPAVGDLRGNGELEVVVGDFGNVVTAFDGRTGEPFWRRWLGPDNGIYSTPVVADLDGDGQQDVVVGVKGEVRNMVAILDGRSGKLKRTFGSGAQIFGTALIADLDGDGIPSIVIGDEDGRLHAIPGRRR